MGTTGRVETKQCVFELSGPARCNFTALEILGGREVGTFEHFRHSKQNLRSCNKLMLCCFLSFHWT